MDNADKKAKFALAVLKHTIPHFDSGGTVHTQDVPNPTQLAGSSRSSGNPSLNNQNPVAAANTYMNPGGILGGSNSVASQIFNPVGTLFGGTQNSFQAQAANLTPGTNTAQLQNAYDTSQSGLTNQQNFVSALQGQNGIGNQNANYNQLSGIANGTGPNPAQAMLNNQTGQNVANQAALMAGQRGSGANAGMIARQAAQQGANTQQQAAGQGAALQAQQSLNAINAQTGIAQNQVNQLGQGITGYNNAAQNEQNILQQANTAYNNANVNMQNGMNTVNGQTAAGNAANKQGIIGGLMNSVSSIFAEGGEVEADLGKSEYTNPSEDSSSSSAPPAAAPAPASSGKDSGGGLGSIIGTVAALLADGGPVKANVSGPQSKFAKALSKQGSSMAASQSGSPYAVNYQAGMQAGQGIGNAIGKGAKALFSSSPDDSNDNAQVPDDAIQQYDPNMLKAAEGGKVPALVSPGEQYLPPKDVKKVAEGKANPLSTGERIPGKPKFKGNNYANDTVPKTLEAGGIVIPNKVMQSKNPHWEAMKFVHATMAKSRNKK